MKVILMLAVSALISMPTFAKDVTVKLTQEEIRMALNLVNKYEVPLETKGPCSKTEFHVIDSVRGFNPAKWTLQKNDISVQLTNQEIAALIGLHNRLEIPAVQIDSITMKTDIKIVGASCGFSPNTWTVTFDDLK